MIQTPWTMKRASHYNYLLLLCLLVASLSVKSQEYELVIRNGKVLDGGANPWVAADIAIKEGKIAKIGFIPGKGKREIDANDLYVSPGWIDMMDQSGYGLLKNGHAYNKIAMGVTTLIGGEGGFPVSAEEIPSYFQQLERQGISVNFGSYYSGVQARMAVFGAGAGDPTPKQLDKMKALVAKAMEGGAMGLSSALIYPPSAYHSTEELIELCKEVAKYQGFYATHMRDESGKLLEAIAEAIRIGEESGSKVEVFHLKAAYEPGWNQLMIEALELIEEARSRGVDVAADLYPYEAGGTGLDVSVPNWVFADGRGKAIERLKDPKQRVRMKKELAAGPLPGWTNIVHASGGWKNVVLANSHLEKYEPYHGKNMQSIAKELGVDPADLAWDIMLEAAPKRPLALYFMMSEEDIMHALKKPWVSIGSDAASALEPGAIDAIGLPHPRSYGTFPRIIARYVKELKVFSLEEAIRKMTSWPASRMGLTNRGMIKEGLAADITIFDLKTLEDKANWEEPTLFAEGVQYVIVNGELVLDQGKHTKATPGQVLLGPGVKK